MKKIVLMALLMLSGYWLKAQISVSFSNYVTSCNNNGSVQANVTGGVAPYTYEWYSYSNQTTPVSTSAILSNVAGGYYYVNVTDVNGLMANFYGVTIQSVVNAYPSNITSANCPASDGSVTYTVTSGVAPFDYAWSNGQTFTNQSIASSTITNLSQGQYSVIITDANGCTFGNPDSVAYVYGTAPFTVTTSTTSANCNDGTATAVVTGTGTAPYTYYWTTTPPQTGITATGLNGGTGLSVIVTDANGCNSNGYAYIPYGPGALQVNGSTSSAICPNNNGSVNITVSGGNAPYTYAWSTGATTQDISGLAPGSYSLTVTDNLGCNISVVKYIGQNSTINASITATPTGCANNTGSATVTPNGGVAPYTYLWGNGQTTATITGLSAGYYGVYVTDANGCHNNSYATGYVSIPQSCYNGVSGYVFNDMDGNCAVNGAETGLPWQVIDLGNGMFSSTGATGYYQYSTLALNTYTISHTPSSANWNLVCPVANYTVSPIAGQLVGGNNFYDEPTSLQNDISIYVYGGLARPGFNHNKYYNIYNNGTTSMSGTAEIVHDAQETFLGGNNVIAYDPLTRTITVAYGNIGPFASAYGNLNFSLPSSVAIGTLLTTTGTANPVSGDLTPADNVFTSVVTVVGSYDPNIKEVSPKGTGASGLIPANTNDMDYTIHFQNTGTYMAETVVIVDTLDQDLDIASFELVGASHNVTWQLSGPRILKFSFNYIYLPDSTSNEPASHGLVSYRIKQKAGLAGGTEIKNTAYIYFDYNAPIVTNTTLNTIEIVGVKENAYNSGITISPNPAQDKITLTNKTKEVCAKVEIMDINGRIITSVIPTGTSISLPEMASGVYIVNAHYNSGVYKEKLIISK